MSIYAVKRFKSDKILILEDYSSYLKVDSSSNRDKNSRSDK